MRNLHRKEFDNTSRSKFKLEKVPLSFLCKLVQTQPVHVDVFSSKFEDIKYGYLNELEFGSIYKEHPYVEVY